jgi:hypothetical protein
VTSLAECAWGHSKKLKIFKSAQSMSKERAQYIYVKGVEVDIKKFKKFEPFKNKNNGNNRRFIGRRVSSACYIECKKY